MGMQETHSAWVVAAGVLLLGMGVVSYLYAVPQLVRSIVSEKVALSEGSEALARFQRTPQPLYFHVYLFHVENPEAVSGQGARPVLSEKGPYIYDMHRERVDLQFHDEDDTVSYLVKNTYVFNKKKSGCRAESDAVTVIHAPILGTALKLQQVSSIGLGTFNDAVPLLFSNTHNIFLKTTVGELLFGGVFVNCSFPADSFPAGAVCQGLRARAPPTYRRADTNFYFSMFSHLNGTSSERLRVGRGERDVASVGRIAAVRGNATLATWRAGTPCNLVNGTDGTVFPPFLRAAPRALPIYTSASCRSLYLHHRADVDLAGVPLMRFVIDADMLASGRDYAPNRCFCVIPPTEQTDAEEEEEPQPEPQRPKPSIEEQELQACLPQGAMDLSPCSGSPVILTFPHFYLGDKAFLEYPIGLTPDEEQHQTIVDIEPTTGTPMRAKKRVQLNMFLKKMDDFNLLTSVSEGLFPILWMEEGITLEGSSLAKVVSAQRALAALRALPLAALALGAALLLAGLAFLSGAAPALAALCCSRPRPRPAPPKARAAPSSLGSPGSRAATITPDAGDAANGHFRLTMGFGHGDVAFPTKQARMVASNNALSYRGGLGGPDGLGVSPVDHYWRGPPVGT